VTFAKAVPAVYGRISRRSRKGRRFPQRSPITYFDFINSTTHLLAIQGANDPRVVKYESDQIVERLRRKNMNIEYMVIEDEGHGFTKYSNVVKALKKSADFLVEKLSIQ
jgi:dipeptidyl aminopeptidase/acylaminoacyl peptidase